MRRKVKVVLYELLVSYINHERRTHYLGCQFISPRSLPRPPNVVDRESSYGQEGALICRYHTQYTFSAVALTPDADTIRIMTVVQSLSEYE